jgi:hypothetical protein
MNLEELVGRWEQTGLLEGLPSVDKAIISTKLESAVLYLLQDESKYKITQPGLPDYDASTIMLAMIRRVFGLGCRNFNPIQFMDDFKDWMINEGGYIKMLELGSIHLNGIDGEAEISALYSEMYRSNYKENIGPTQYIPKHKL